MNHGSQRLSLTLPFWNFADVTLSNEQVDGEMHNDGEDVSEGVGKVLHGALELVSVINLATKYVVGCHWDGDRQMHEIDVEVVGWVWGVLVCGH